MNNLKIKVSLFLILIFTLSCHWQMIEFYKNTKLNSILLLHQKKLFSKQKQLIENLNKEKRDEEIIGYNNRLNEIYVDTKDQDYYTNRNIYYMRDEFKNAKDKTTFYDIYNAINTFYINLNKNIDYLLNSLKESDYKKIIDDFKKINKSAPASRYFYAIENISDFLLIIRAYRSHLKYFGDENLLKRELKERHNLDFNIENVVKNQFDLYDKILEKFPYFKKEYIKIVFSLYND